MISSRRALRIWVVALLALSGCAKGGDAGKAGHPESKVAVGNEIQGITAWFPLTVGEKALRVQVVVTMDEQQRGLMGRKDLGADDGMIFVYPAPQEMSFWMSNTPTPLDIGFFTADGVLGEVYPMYAFDKTTVKSVGQDYTLALEVNQGWFAKNGLKPGVKINQGEVAAALRARGFRPQRYSINVE